MILFILQDDGKNQPFGHPRANPSTALRTSTRGLLSLPAGRQGLILSGVFDPS
jgi:hypothetical protein